MIIANCGQVVHVSRLIRIGRETAGEKISVVVADNQGCEQIALIYPNELLGSFPRFQRGLLRASGVYFDHPAFSSGPGRARRWHKLVYRLLKEAGK